MIGIGLVTCPKDKSDKTAKCGCVRLHRIGQGIPGLALVIRSTWYQYNSKVHLVSLRIAELLLCSSKSLELFLDERRPETQSALLLALELVV